MLLFFRNLIGQKNTFPCQEESIEEGEIMDVDGKDGEKRMVKEPGARDLRLECGWARMD